MIARFLLRLTVSSIFLPAIGLSAPLEQAKVTKIINDVRLDNPGTGERKAQLDDTVQGDIGLITGVKSRSELLFNDNTLTRVGPESYFSFKTGTRDMTLGRGTLLLQVPKGLGGAKIHTAAITAAITGTTIMMEYVPKQTLKVLVLEGSLRLSVNHTFGDSLLLQPGKMVIMKPDAKHIPDPVTVNIKKVTETSQLIHLYKKNQNDDAPLPSAGLIDQEIAKQDKGFGAKNLIATNLVILGKGTNVVLGSDQLLSDLDNRTDVKKLAAIPSPTPGAAPTPPPPATTYTIDNTTTITTHVSSARITTQGVNEFGTVYKNLPTNGSPAEFLFGGLSSFDTTFGFNNFYDQQFHESAVFVFDSLLLSGGIAFDTNDGTNSVTIVGINGITNSAASTVNLSGVKDILFATKSGDIILDSGISFETSIGGKPDLVQFYARGGDVNIGSTFNLPNTNLGFTAENNALFGATSSIVAKNVTITGLQTAQFDGTANLANDGVFQLNGGILEMGGTVTAHAAVFNGTSAVVNGSFTGEDLTANVTGDFTLNGSVALSGDHQLQISAGGTTTIAGTLSGKLTINSHDIVFGTDIANGNNGDLTATGDIDATGHQLSGFDQISVTGNFTATTASANKFIIGGSLHADSVTANNSITVNTSDLAPYATSTISLTAPTVSLLAGANLDGQNGTPLLIPGNAKNLSINTNNHDFTLGANVSLNGGDGDISVNDAGGNGGTLSITANNLTLNALISASSGQNSNNSLTGGNGGTVNLTGNNTITLNNTIEVSSDDGNRRRSASGGNINVTSTATGGTAITVSSSAQLLALLNAVAPGPGGSIKFTSAGGAINMNGTARADSGTIEMTNNGATGQVNLTNATLNASTVKAGALGNSGTLNIGGGTISADTLIKLYANSSNGNVNFTQDVTLSGNSAKIIAGNSVTIFNGRTVTINGLGPADVYTNNANYTGSGGNNSTTGQFGGQGANTHLGVLPPGY